MRSALIGIIVALSTIATIPHTYAMSLGQAFSESMTSSSFSYQTNGSLDFSRGGESDLPFDISITGEERGGKQSGMLGSTGEASFSLKNIQDLPSELSDLQSISGGFSYNFSYIEKNAVSYSEIVQAHLESNNTKVSKITDMLNQFAKFITGRTFRSSGEQLKKLLSEQMGGMGMGADEEVFLQLLSGGKSIDQIVDSSGQLLDALILSGMLRDEVSGGQVRSLRGYGEGITETHRITLGSVISEQGAKVLNDAILNFVKELFPAVANEMSRDMANGLGVTTNELNDFLKSAAAADVEFIVVLNGNHVTEISSKLSLGGMNVPLRLQASARFDYSRGYDVVIPNDQNKIIDVDKIFEGIMTMAKLGTSDFSTSEFDPSAFDSGFMNAHPGEQDILNNIFAACPDYGKPCARRELNKQLRWVRNQYTAADYQALRRTLLQDINIYFY